jgi:hypothetical protein
LAFVVLGNSKKRDVIQLQQSSISFDILTPGKVVSPTDIHVIPMESGDESAYNVFCYAALADKHTGTMYTNATDVILWLMYTIQITSLPFRIII